MHSSRGIGNVFSVDYGKEKIQMWVIRKTVISACAQSDLGHSSERSDITATTDPAQVGTQPHLLVTSNPSLSKSAWHQENRHHCISSVQTQKVNCGSKTTSSCKSDEMSLLSRKACSYTLSSFLFSLIPPQNGTTEWLLFPTKDFPNET